MKFNLLFYFVFINIFMTGMVPIYDRIFTHLYTWYAKINLLSWEIWWNNFTSDTNSYRYVQQYNTFERWVTINSEYSYWFFSFTSGLFQLLTRKCFSDLKEQFLFNSSFNDLLTWIVDIYYNFNSILQLSRLLPFVIWLGHIVASRVIYSFLETHCHFSCVLFLADDTLLFWFLERTVALLL